jgi:hypothetical protein
MRLYGIDFSSSPRRSKPIVVAAGHMDEESAHLDSLEVLPDWPAFEAFLARPGPWLGGFDFPFGLPREAVADLGWPQDWPALVRHCAALGRAGFRAALDSYRQSRPLGCRYAYRATDLPAAAHSPMKLVNPPVGLMFLEGAPRLLAAGVTVPGMQQGELDRIALEAYPGLLARAIVPCSYKADERARQSTERRTARATMVGRLASGDHPYGIELAVEAELAAELIDDGSGDRLDAALALVQAAWAWRQRQSHFGLPEDFDPLEGWILGS